jgi:NitT/TauT family transport system ATP-binding protein
VTVEQSRRDSGSDDAQQLAVELHDVVRIVDGKDGSTVALDDVSLAVRQGEFLSVVGPSGCGKSTLLTLIAGLARPDAGTVTVLGKPVTGVDRSIGFIFQRDALLPWRTAVQNVALGLRYRGVRRREAHERARDWLGRVGLEKVGGRYPAQLSGGMRKRVQIAATLACEPQILLMDEPFSALDVQTRTLMENDLLSIWDSSGQTVIFITHDLEEAIGLSDRVVVMSAGPGHVIGSHAITLERPRDLLEIRFDPEFLKLHHILWESLREEVLRANGGH